MFIGVRVLVFTFACVLARARAPHCSSIWVSTTDAWAAIQMSSLWRGRREREEGGRSGTGRVSERGWPGKGGGVASERDGDGRDRDDNEMTTRDIVMQLGRMGRALSGRVDSDGGHVSRGHGVP